MKLIKTMFTLLKLKYHCVLMSALIVAVNMADTSLCKPNFKYHDSTHTCMQLIKQSSYYDTGKDNCKKFRGGPSNNPGHLVYIFDNDTDIFIRDLLPNEMITAYIGLNVLWEGGNSYIYRWGNLRQPADYFGWEGETPTSEYLAVVAISKKGWKQVKKSEQKFYICQVDSEIQLPTIAMTCPSLLMGRASPQIQCVIGKGLSVTGSEFRINDMRAMCATTDCAATEGYRVSVKDTDQSFSMSLNIKSVRQSDEGLLTCEWQFADYAKKLNYSCYMRVYDPPTSAPELIKLPSNEAYKKGDIINITCTVHGGSPIVNSTTIKCDPEIRDTSAQWYVVIDNGNTANMNVIITREMNGKSCNCSGQHVSRLYNLHSSLTLTVIDPAKITKMTFLGAYSRGDFWEVDAMKEVRIACTASGYPTPSISLHYTDSKNLLNTVTEYQLSYTKRISCNDSGTYICVASNNQNEAPHTLQESLRARCRPTLCSTEEKNLQYGVRLNNNATIKICVHAYPTPSGLIPYKGISSVPNRKYSLKFDYTDEVRCRGLISLTLNDVRQEDMGKYSLLMGTDFLQFTFSFVPQGPPKCPKEIKVIDVFKDMITIAWKPGNDGGLQQTFIVLRLDVVKEVGKVQDTKNDVMEYNVTGLSPMTSYNTSIDVVNELGRTKCTNIYATATTNATSSPQGNESSVSPTTYIIPVVILLLLVVCGVLVVIVARRRKRKNQDIKKMLLLEEVKTRPPKLDESKEKEEEKTLHTSIYNNATLDTSEPKNKIKPIVRKPKRDSSKSKPSSVKDADIKEDDAGTEGDTYTQELKVNKRTEKSDEVTENIYNNQLEIVNQMGDRSSSVPHQLASDLPKNMARYDNDDTVVYANTNKIISNPDVSDSGTTPEWSTMPTETQKQSRTVSPEGLVYVSVEISAATKNPVIKEQKVDEPHEEVEYMSIDHLATSESKLVDEEGGDDQN